MYTITVHPDDAEKYEGAAGETTTVRFIVKRTEPMGEDVESEMVDVSMGNPNGAGSGAFLHNSTSGSHNTTVLFKPGTSEAVITVAVRGDDYIEPDEMIYVQIDGFKTNFTDETSTTQQNTHQKPVAFAHIHDDDAHGITGDETFYERFIKERKTVEDADTHGANFDANALDAIRKGINDLSRDGELTPEEKEAIRKLGRENGVDSDVVERLVEPKETGLDGGLPLPTPGGAHSAAEREKAEKARKEAEKQAEKDAEAELWETSSGDRFDFVPEAHEDGDEDPFEAEFLADGGGDPIEADAIVFEGEPIESIMKIDGADAFEM